MTTATSPASSTDQDQPNLTAQVYEALRRFDRLTIDDIATTFNVSRRDAGDAVMRLLDRDDIVEIGAGIRRLGD